MRREAFGVIVHMRVSANGSLARETGRCGESSSAQSRPIMHCSHNSPMLMTAPSFPLVSPRLVRSRHSSAGQGRHPGVGLAQRQVGGVRHDGRVQPARGTVCCRPHRRLPRGRLHAPVPSAPATAQVVRAVARVPSVPWCLLRGTVVARNAVRMEPAHFPFQAWHICKLPSQPMHFKSAQGIP